MEWYIRGVFPLKVVWHGDQLPYQAYPSLSGRFVSEFGMQALPSIRTIRSFTKDPSPQSRALDNHNKAPGFNRRLLPYILDNFRLRTFDLEELVGQSQRMQCDAVCCAVRGWRRLWKGPGRELCAGTLIWQVLSRGGGGLIVVERLLAGGVVEFGGLLYEA
jgi:beta-mannosidase